MKKVVEMYKFLFVVVLSKGVDECGCKFVVVCRIFLYDVCVYEVSFGVICCGSGRIVRNGGLYIWNC